MCLVDHVIYVLESAVLGPLFAKRLSCSQMTSHLFCWHLPAIQQTSVQGMCVVGTVSRLSGGLPSPAALLELSVAALLLAQPDGPYHNTLLPFTQDMTQLMSQLVSVSAAMHVTGCAASLGSLWQEFG